MYDNNTRETKYSQRSIFTLPPLALDMYMRMYIVHVCVCVCVLVGELVLNPSSIPHARASRRRGVRTINGVEYATVRMQMGIEPIEPYTRCMFCACSVAAGTFG